MSEKQTGCEDVPTDEYCVWVVLPWCSERMAVNNDSDLIDVFKLFSNHEKKSITFEVEKKAYIPLPLEASTNIPNEHPRFIIDNQKTGFSDFEKNLFDYEGDNEDEHSVSGDSDEVIEVDSGRVEAGVDEDEFGLVDGSYDFGLGHGLDEVEKNINLELFEGYNSHPDDEFVSDSEAENMDAKIARLVKTNPFKQLLGTPIEFEISGVPCSHALAGIRHFYGMSGINEGITQFIHPSLSKSAFLTSYSSMISPIPDFCVWVDMEAATVDPPLIKNKPGRPKLVRKRELHEKPKASRSGSVICTKCRNPGHNKRTCKAVITSESNKKRAAKDVNKSSTNARVEVGASSSQPPTQVQTQLQSQVTM
ncbi:hypothetical protein Q3G72_027259 [Acer saccharum]|nr:hypothetical protein Q3G72_027259 [Acer saccharum]